MWLPLSGWGWKIILEINPATPFPLPGWNCPSEINMTRKKGRHMKLTLDNYEVCGLGEQGEVKWVEIWLCIWRKEVWMWTPNVILPHMTKWTQPGIHCNCRSGFWCKIITSSVYNLVFQLSMWKDKISG